MQKFKRFRGEFARAMEWLQQVYLHQPELFRPLAADRVHRKQDCGAG
jgi:hypothetical protein